MIQDIEYHIFDVKTKLMNHGKFLANAEEIYEDLDRLREDIEDIKNQLLDQGIEQAVQVGYEKKGIDFINDIRPSESSFRITTETGQTEYNTPPRPNLQNLLKNAKMSKKGFAYKVIPIGSDNSGQYRMSNSIFDTQKRQIVEQLETQKAIRARVDKTFRTATSKQDPSSAWVRPGQDNDFSKDLYNINISLEEQLEEQIYMAKNRILQKYGVYV